MLFEGGERLKSGRLVEMSALKNTGKHISKIRGNEGLMGKDRNIFGVSGKNKIDSLRRVFNIHI